MALFSYSAVDVAGQRITGSIEADTRDDVVRLLQERNLIITKISEGIGEISKIKHKDREFALLRGVSSYELMIFTRELATMISSGLPIVESLYILAEDAENPRLRKVVRTLAGKLVGGYSLSEALKEFPRYFDSMYINLIKVGEKSGNFENILFQLAMFLESMENLKKKIVSSLYYPIAVVLFTLSVVILLFAFVVPRFQEIYTGLDKELPPITNALFGIAGFLKTWFIWIALFIVMVIYIFQNLTRIGPGLLFKDTMKLHIPVLGGIIKKLIVTRFARTLGLLYSSGVPIIESMNLVAQSVGNAFVEREIKKASQSVMQGNRITGTLEKSGIFPNMVTHMIDVGERTGKLPDMLEKIADFYDVQVKSAVDGLVSLIEPMLIIFLGCVIAFIVLGMFLPIINLPTFIQ